MSTLSLLIPVSILTISMSLKVVVRRSVVRRVIKAALIPCVILTNTSRASVLLAVLCRISVTTLRTGNSSSVLLIFVEGMTGRSTVPTTDLLPAVHVTVWATCPLTLTIGPLSNIRMVHFILTAARFVRTIILIVLKGAMSIIPNN